VPFTHKAWEPGVPGGNIAGFGGSAVAIRREKQSRHGRKQVPGRSYHYSPGCCALQPFAFTYPSPGSPALRPPCSPAWGCTPHLPPGELQSWGVRGDGETAGICRLLGSVSVPSALPCSSTCSASCSTWEDVAHGVCCPAQNKCTAARASSPEHREHPCPAEKSPMFNFALAKQAASKKSDGRPQQLTHFLSSHYQNHTILCRQQAGCFKSFFTVSHPNHDRLSKTSTRAYQPLPCGCTDWDELRYRHVPTGLAPKASGFSPELTSTLTDLLEQVPGGKHRTCQPPRPVTSDGEELGDVGDLNHTASMQPQVPASRSQAWEPAQLTPLGSSSLLCSWRGFFTPARCSSARAQDPGSQKRSAFKAFFLSS